MIATNPPRRDEAVTPLLAAVFFCELAMLAGLAFVGATLVSGAAASIALAVTLPLVVALLWGMLLAPRASRRLPDIPRVVLKVVLFFGTGVALAAVGYLIAGIALAVIAGVCVVAGEVRAGLA